MKKSTTWWGYNERECERGYQNSSYTFTSTGMSATSNQTIRKN